MRHHLSTLIIAAFLLVFSLTPSKAQSRIDSLIFNFKTVEITVPSGSWGQQGLTGWLKWSVGRKLFNEWSSKTIKMPGGTKSTFVELWIEASQKLNPGKDIHIIFPGEKIRVLAPDELPKLINECTKNETLISNLKKERENMKNELLVDSLLQKGLFYALVKKQMELNQVKKDFVGEPQKFFLSFGDQIHKGNFDFTGVIGHVRTNGDALVGSYSSLINLKGDKVVYNASLFGKTKFMTASISALAQDTWIHDDTGRDFFEIPSMDFWIDKKLTLTNDDYSFNNYFSLSYSYTWEGRENNYVNALPAKVGLSYLFNMKPNHDPGSQEITILFSGATYKGIGGFDYSFGLSSFPAENLMMVQRLATGIILNYFPIIGDEGFYMSFSKYSRGSSSNTLRYLLSEDGSPFYRESRTLNFLLSTPLLGLGFTGTFEKPWKGDGTNKFYEGRIFLPKFDHLTPYIGGGSYGKKHPFFSVGLNLSY